MKVVGVRDANQAKQELCQIGRRLYDRGFIAANEGNLSFRLNENEILCTPTMHSKGFLDPEDLVTVDPTGKPLGGQHQPSSEIRLHLAIYRARPDVSAVVHCHPPHATAFAIAGEPIPTGVTAEVETYLGHVPTAPYAKPGTEALAQSVVPHLHNTRVALLANHGAVSYDTTLERALWSIEILDAYCRMILLARQLGGEQKLTDQQLAELPSSRLND